MRLNPFIMIADTLPGRIIMKRSLLLILWLTAPWPSFAGQGYVIQLMNRLEVTQKAPTAADKQYPLVTVHAVDGATCWYNKDLDNWDKFAMAMGLGIELYTEQEENFLNSCGHGGAKLRDFALFIKTSADAGWKRLSSPIMQFSHESEWDRECANSSDGSGGCTSTLIEERYILKKLTPSVELARITHQRTWKDKKIHGFTTEPYCGVQIGSGSSYLWLNDRPTLRLWVDGKFDETCLSATSASTSAAGVLAEPDARPSSTIQVKMRVGQSRKIRLPSLSDNTAWELEGCEGDVVTTGGVIPRQPKTKLPNVVSVTAVKSGTEECVVQAWTYSSEMATRKLHQTLKYVFEVK